MNFDLNFTPVTLILLAVSFIALLLLTTVYQRFVTTVWRQSIADNEDADNQSSKPLPEVSVVVYATPDCDSLAQTLTMILDQDYPAPFDVTVVNDGESEDVKDIVNLLNNKYKNLFITFVPDQAHSLSRRKLAMTLGVKSARYQCVVFTNAGVKIESTSWLRLMTRPFAEGKDVVIGYCAMEAGCDNSSMRTFDRVATAAAYLGSAIDGKPYRANNNNLVINKKVFLDNKGFSRSLNLHGGDDDIFISEIADSANTAVVLASESILYFTTNNPAKYHRLDKTSHIFTGRHIHKSGQIMMSLGSWCRFIGLASGVAAAITALPSIVPAIWVVLTFIATCIIMSFAWSKTATAIGEKMSGFGATFFSLIRPIYNLYFKILSFVTRRQNFTWS